jgi:excisionase family DNA binding protein
MDKELMDIQEAAAFLGINQEVLRRWAREGRIPAGKLGREWRFSRRLLVEHVEAGGSQPVADTDRVRVGA